LSKEPYTSYIELRNEPFFLRVCVFPQPGTAPHFTLFKCMFIT